MAASGRRAWAGGFQRVGMRRVGLRPEAGVRGGVGGVRGWRARWAVGWCLGCAGRGGRAGGGLAPSVRCVARVRVAGCAARFVASVRPVGAGGFRGSWLPRGPEGTHRGPPPAFGREVPPRRGRIWSMGLRTPACAPVLRAVPGTSPPAYVRSRLRPGGAVRHRPHAGFRRVVAVPEMAELRPPGAGTNDLPLPGQCPPRGPGSPKSGVGRGARGRVRAVARTARGPGEGVGPGGAGVCSVSGRFVCG